MKIRYPIFVLTALLMLAGAAARAQSPSISHWSEINPSITFSGQRLQDMDGKEIDPAAMTDHPLLVNFWATWCAPCIAELPALDSLAAALEKHGVKILAVSQDMGGAAQVRDFFAKHPAPTHLTLVIDKSRDTGRALGITDLPTTLAIDKTGKARARLIGPGDWRDPAMRSQVESLLGF